jgi:hypothetical protein
MHKTPLRLLVGLSVCAIACGDDDGAASASDSATDSGSSSATTGDTNPTTTATTMTTNMSADGSSSTDDPSTVSADSSTSPSTTDDPTGSSSDSGEVTSDTSPPTTESSSSGVGSSSGPQESSSSSGAALVCDPGETTCVNANQMATCLPDGTDFDLPVDCAGTEECYIGACTPLCEIAIDSPSSVGCSFFTTKMDNFYNNVGNPAQNDSLTVGNVSDSLVVNAQLYFVPVNGAAEQAVGNVQQIQPQGTYTWQLDVPEIDSVSTLRVGGVYRVETDIPVVAYSHSPIAATATNDSSMLLPEHALTGNYIVASYPGTVGQYPSYFTAIGIADGTTVDFTVTAATAAGAGVGALAANATGQALMNRYDLLNVVVATQQGGDLSGTQITADQPLFVVGATECANVPNAGTTFCDHVEEVLLPLEYWGDEYVGAHAPERGNESYHWRVYSGDAAVTIDTEPAQPGFPVILDAGEWFQFETDVSVVFTGDGPFLPVQYLEGENGGAGTGDPAMIQSVPVEQFLSRYAFVTGTGYTEHYAQIIRPMGGDDVFIDGNQVGGYVAVGEFEVSDWPVSEGAHFAVSDSPFGIVQVGYTGVTSYGYPGGLRLQVINPQ